MRQNEEYCLTVGRGSVVLVRTDAASAPDDLGSELSAVPGAAAQRVRIVDALLACIARHGLAKTTVDDVARAAGCSRATLYRAFPGGKEGLLRAAVDTELSRLFSDLAVRMGGETSLEGVLVTGMTGAAVRVGEHPALGFLLEHEPEVVLPHLAFDHHDRLLSVLGSYAAPFLGRWLDHDEAERVAEWATRIVVSYLTCPAPGVDLTDEGDVRRLVRAYVLPGIRVMSAEADALLPLVPSPSSFRRKGAAAVLRNTISQSEGEAS
jgi:AcrR family transcriptional regulator